MNNQYLLFDRDGTICRDYPDDQWSGKTKAQLIKKTIIYLKRHRQAKIIILSNQYLVNEKFMTKRDFKKFHVDFDCQLRKEGIYVYKYYYAMAKRSENDFYTKPQTGMITKFSNDFPNIDIEKLCYVGDSNTDKIMANNAGISFCHIMDLKLNI